MKVDFNLEARWELCLGLIKKSSSPPSHRHLSKKYQHTLPIAAKFNLEPPTSHSLMLWRQKNGLSMSLIRTQGLLTTDKVPQWGREKIFRKKNSRPRSNGYDSKTKRDPTAKNVVFHKTTNAPWKKKLLISAKKMVILGLILGRDQFWSLPCSRHWRAKCRKWKRVCFCGRIKEKRRKMGVTNTKKVVVSGVLVICPVDKNCGSKTKKTNFDLIYR